jgi:S1-C subfamily serine protease
MAPTNKPQPSRKAPDPGLVGKVLQPKPPAWWRRPWVLVLAGLLVGMALSLLIALATRPAPVAALTQEDFDAAVLRTAQTQVLPSQAARAAEMVRPAVVRVRSYVDVPKDLVAAKKAKPGELVETEEQLFGEGSGVVIKEDGTILTNLHVVQGGGRLVVTFFDGMEANAFVVGVQANNDLAVIRTQKVPDDLQPATMGSTGQLNPGDEVVAVGFPFGIGPSVSQGVISGLGRKFKSPKTGQELSGLIQFDAAANPGNSGGPLVAMDGSVIGIVTAILNPTEARTFIGIGFAVTMEAAGNAVGIPPF